MTGPLTPLAQLVARRMDVRLVCGECGASVIAPTADILRHFGPNVVLADLEDRAVCARCGGLSVAAEPEDVSLASKPQRSPSSSDGRTPARFGSIS